MCEGKEQVHVPKSLGIGEGGVTMPPQPRDQGRRRGRMCRAHTVADPDGLISKAMLLCKQTYNYTCMVHIHAYSHLYVCMNVARLHACRNVHRIWTNMNLMVYMDANVVNMVNTVIEIWFRKYGPRRQLLSFQN